MAEKVGTDQYAFFRVFDADGTSGRVERTLRDPGGAGETVAVRLDSGGRVLVPTSELRQRADGAYELPVAFGELSAATGRGSGASESAVDSDVDSTVTIPVIEEELEVGKERVETGRVRVSKHVREREELVEELVAHEEVDVERVPIGEFVDGPVPVRTEGDTIVIPLLEEVLVVQRRLVVKEEVRITRRRAESVATERVTLMSEEVEVERLPPDGPPPGR